MRRVALLVDIGNSGLRVARALPDGASSHNPDSFPISTDVVRVNWKLAGSCDPPVHSVPGPAHVGEELQRFDPADPNWAPLLMQRALALWPDLVPREDATSTSHPGSIAQPQIELDWFVSSVHRGAVARLVDYLRSSPRNRVHIATREDIDLRVEVDAPDKVGIDRLLAASAAVDLVRTRPLIVVQAGSAITVDWLPEDRVFAGGAIMPGVPMMLRLLSQAADLLPNVAAEELTELPSLPGRDTASAMVCGVSSAVVGGVCHLIHRYREQARSAGQRTPIVVLSGGDGPRIAKHLPQPVEEFPHLVLQGLCKLARTRASKLPL